MPEYYLRLSALCYCRLALSDKALGTGLYLTQQLNPVVEAQIERVLTMANVTVSNPPCLQAPCKNTSLKVN